MKLIKIDLREYCGQIQNRSIFINQVNRVSRNVLICVCVCFYVSVCKWHINYILNVQLLLLLFLTCDYSRLSPSLNVFFSLHSHSAHSIVVIFPCLFHRAVFIVLDHSHSHSRTHYLSLLPIIIFNWFHIEYSVIVTDHFLDFTE